MQTAPKSAVLFAVCAVIALAIPTSAPADTFPAADPAQVECQNLQASTSRCMTLANEVWQLHQADTERFKDLDLSIDAYLITDHTPILWPNGQWGYGIPSLLQLVSAGFHDHPVSIQDIDLSQLRLEPIDERTVLLWGPIPISYRDLVDGELHDLKLEETFVYRQLSNSPYGWIRLFQQVALDSPVP